MEVKFTKNNSIHRLPAGILPADNATELFGCRETRKVFGISSGTTIPFSGLDPAKRAAIFEMLLNDPEAMADLQHLDHETALERFAFCVFGAADHEPDFDAAGNLGKADNFICGNNCNCLAWRSKSITFEGHPLTYRQVQIVQLLASDKRDCEIAGELCIQKCTLSTHKQQLYAIFNVNSRAGLVTKATQQKIIQYRQ